MSQQAEGKARRARLRAIEAADRKSFDQLNRCGGRQVTQLGLTNGGSR